MHCGVVQKLAVHGVVLHWDVPPRLQFVMAVVRQSLLHDEIWSVRSIPGAHFPHVVTSEGIEFGRHVTLIFELPGTRGAFFNVLSPDFRSG